MFNIVYLIVVGLSVAKSLDGGIRSYEDVLYRPGWTIEPRSDNVMKVLGSPLVEKAPQSIDINVDIRTSDSNETNVGTALKKSCIWLVPDGILCQDEKFRLIDPICNAELRIPLLDTWDYWKSLESPTINERSAYTWTSVNHNRLEKTLMDPMTGAYMRDGTRKAYLQYKVQGSNFFRFHNALKPSTDNIQICYSNFSVIGMIRKRASAEIVRTSFLTESSMRVFFEPGWRLKKLVSGYGLSTEDRLAIKLSDCSGKMDERAMHVANPRALTVTTHTVSPRATDRLPRPSLQWFSAQFDIIVTPSEDFDATSDWRRAAFLLKRRERRDRIINNLALTPTPKPPSHPSSKVRPVASANPENGLRMFLCYYFDPTDGNGIRIGATQFSLASSDAAEFVALSIFLLLGLPIYCMWTIGCLGYKHRKLRIELRRLRLVQIRDTIETRLAMHLGFRQKDEESSESSGDSGETPRKCVTSKPADLSDDMRSDPTRDDAIPDVIAPLLNGSYTN